MPFHNEQPFHNITQETEEEPKVSLQHHIKRVLKITTAATKLFILNLCSLSILYRCERQNRCVTRDRFEREISSTLTLWFRFSKQLCKMFSCLWLCFLPVIVFLVFLDLWSMICGFCLILYMFCVQFWFKKLQNLFWSYWQPPDNL